MSARPVGVMSDHQHVNATETTGSASPPEDLTAAFVLVAHGLRSPVDACALDQLRSSETLSTWPLRDAESRRGLALLEESSIAAEDAEFIDADAERFGGQDGFGQAFAAPPGARAEIDALVVCGAGDSDADTDASITLCAYGMSLSTCPPGLGSHRREAAVARLRTSHLQQWVRHALHQLQLGARSYYYQGLATLGLRLLNHQPTSDPAQ